MAQGHNFQPSGIHARDLHSGLIGLGAAVADKALADFSGSDLRQFFRQGHDGFVREDGGSMLQLVHLRFDLGSDARVSMAHGDGHDAAEEIQILVAINVPYVLHGRMVGHERVVVIRGDGREKVLLMFPDNFVFGHY